jgi:hypothetical protein
MRSLSRRLLLAAAVAGISVPLQSCYFPTEPAVTSKCAPGYCYIRSAYTCCPNGYLNYAGAGSGCYARRDDCLKAGGGKCWYETSCIQ